MTLKIAIAGAAGRMGQTLTRLAGPEFAIVGGTERPGSPLLGTSFGTGSVADSAAQAAANADVWIDFTTPVATLAALESLKSTSVKAAILGATGWTAEQDALVAPHAKRIAIVKSGNYSLGVNMLLALVEKAASSLGPDWDIEISEMHHHHKVDAPSGTALMIGEAAARGRGKTLKELRTPPYDGITGPRKEGSIGFVVSRAGGVIGDHEARFASEQEIVTFSHRALDRALFAKGALAAAKWVADRKPGLYTMRDVLAV